MITSSSPDFLPRETFTSFPLFSVPRNVQCHNVVAFTDLTLLWLFAKITVANRSICVSHKICATFPLSVPLLPGWQPFSYVRSVSQCFWAKAWVRFHNAWPRLGWRRRRRALVMTHPLKPTFRLSCLLGTQVLNSGVFAVSEEKSSQSMTFLSDGNFTFALSIFVVHGPVVTRKDKTNPTATIIFEADIQGLC